MRRKISLEQRDSSQLAHEKNWQFWKGYGGLLRVEEHHTVYSADSEVKTKRINNFYRV